MCKVDGKPILVGIVTRGKSCGLENYPGIYTSVAEFSDWISETTNREILLTDISKNIEDFIYPSEPTSAPVTQE